MLSQPSTRPSDARGRRSSAFVRERHLAIVTLQISVLQSHLLHERTPARIAVKGAQEWGGPGGGEPAVPLRVRALEPLEGGVDLAPRTMDLRDLEGRPSLVFLDQIPERRLRIGAMAQTVMKDGERLEAVDLVRIA